ncbi:hypothetical protein PWT90_02664 [Aphanocladium album]|nr:hypothetical protein PWT90_02664 [Aphanocladium album]
MRPQTVSIVAFAALAECKLQCAKNITGTCVDMQVFASTEYHGPITGLAPLCLDDKGELTVNATINLNGCLTILQGGQMVPGEGYQTYGAVFTLCQIANVYFALNRIYGWCTNYTMVDGKHNVLEAQCFDGHRETRPTTIKLGALAAP